MLPDDLIKFILLNDWYIGAYPGLVKLLEDHISEHKYVIKYDPKHEPGTRFHVALFESRQEYDRWVEMDRQLTERVERQREIDKRISERKEAFEMSPIMVELRHAIETQNWIRVLEIKQILKSAEMDVSHLEIKTLMRNARTTKTPIEKKD